MGRQDVSPGPTSHCGVGGNSPLRERETDRFGIGWYYGAANQGTYFKPGDGTGVEMFYNVAVTPWFELTPDLQILDGGSMRNPDTAYIFALRGNLRF